MRKKYIDKKNFMKYDYNIIPGKSPVSAAARGIRAAATLFEKEGFLRGFRRSQIQLNIIKGEDIIQEIKILRKTDIVLIAAFLLFAGMFYFIFNLNSKTGDTAVIKLNGKVYAEVSLSENKDVEVCLDDGTLLNIVRIQDKKAFIIYAECPNKLCVKHKPIDSESYINNIIACLPNRVTVEIITDKKDKDKDKDKFDIIIGN